MNTAMILFNRFGYNSFSKNEAVLAIYEIVPPEYLERVYDKCRSRVIKKVTYTRPYMLTKDKKMYGAKTLFTYLKNNSKKHGTIVFRDELYSFTCKPVHSV